ncbi:MAG TPA: NAD-dependent epimerase/dehydratase family protein [Saprospiraceae bacterium]|nr:NAD-dependent epimerase/dehydratase family protein [Saprospiraceae bacterium]HPI05516.1 NAD-dependent epimerase/dehydratase family protein [Saprospiraceae bacterium]
MQPHTIIGAGGAIGTPLAQLLLEQKQAVRLLSRSGRALAGAESRATDVFNLPELTEAVRGSKVAYLLVGLDYNTKIWQEKWPVVMQNTIRACAVTNVPLVFFDNVYMYGPVEGKMTEETPFRPSSKKGEVRAKIATMLLDAVQRGELKASIARSADFYGPWADEKSMFYQTVFKNYAEGKKAQWLGNPDMPHSMSYTLDCAKGLALLAGDPTSFNQTWHLPTHNPPPVPKDLIQLVAKDMGVPYKGVQVATKTITRLIGLFVPIMREMVEMIYQNEQPYWFDSTKFEQHFQYQPISYEQGILDTIAFYNLKKG